MILGKLASQGISLAKRAAKPAFNKAISKFQQADAVAVRKVNNLIKPKPTLTRDMNVKAKVAAVDAASNSSRNLAKAIVRSSYVAVPAYVAFEATGGGRNVKPRKPASTAPKPYDRKIGPASSAPSPKKSVNSPVKKPVKKPVKMASIPVKKNRRTPTTGPKTQVPVGSSVIRNRDGSIKKVNKPSGNKPKSKYARMTTFQINRLGGREKTAYKKWKASQSK